MATSSQLTARSCHVLQWTTDLVYKNENLVSPVFRIRDIEHYLRFFTDYSDYYLALECTHEASRSQFSSLNAVIYAELLYDERLELVYGPTEKCCYSHLMRNGGFLRIDHSAIKPKMETSNYYRHKMRFTLTFECADRLKLEDRTEDKSVQTSLHFDPKFEIRSLSSDLSKLLKDDSNADLELVCRDRTFTAHRCLLSARSRVFRAMLGSDMAEATTGKVKIEDVDAGIFEQFLEYLYKGTLGELALEDAMQLYKLGDRYAVGALKHQCASYLGANLTQDNSCSILRLAECHGDDYLKESAVSYILDQKVPQDDKWVDFCKDHPVLAIHVLNRFCALHAYCK